MTIKELLPLLINTGPIIVEDKTKNNIELDHEDGKICNPSYQYLENKIVHEIDCNGHWTIFLMIESLEPGKE